MNLPPAASNPDQSHLNLRRQIRQRALKQRKLISHYRQQHAARALCRRIRHLAAYQQADNIGLYLSSRSEIGTHELLKMAWRDGKNCFVPVLHPWHAHHMVFVPYRPGQALHRNRWGIQEPALSTRHIKPKQLDLVMLPLVAFDLSGRRMGMGKGFYDRAFSFRQKGRCKPVLLGLAHDSQLVTGSLPGSHWDVDLDAVATPSHTCFF